MNGLDKLLNVWMNLSSISLTIAPAPAPLLLPTSSISPLAVMWYYMLMGQWTEKVGKSSLTTGCIMDCLCELPLKDTKTWENSTLLQDTLLQRTWWDSNVSSAELVNLKNVPLTSVMSPGCALSWLQSLGARLCPAAHSGVESVQQRRVRRANVPNWTRHVAQFVPRWAIMGGGALRLTAWLPLDPRASVFACYCAQVCECVCACRCSKRTHQAWLCVIHNDESHCSLSPLIVRGNQPVEGDVDREERSLTPPHTHTHFYLCVDNALPRSLHYYHPN